MITRRWGFSILILSLLTGCFSRSVREEVVAIPSDPSLLSDSYLSQWKQTHPVESVGFGFHEYDGRSIVPDARTLAKLRQSLHAYGAAIDQVQWEQVPGANRYELRLLKQWIATDLWSLEIQRDPYRNPMYYATALDVSVYLKRDWKPWVERVRDLSAILLHAPEVLGAARENLERVLPRPYVETAIQVADGTASFLQNEVTREVDHLTDAAAKDGFHKSCALAVRELKGYVEWLKRERLPVAAAPFALGEVGFATRLQAEMIDLSPKEVLELGLVELRREQERFAAAAREIDPTKSPLDVFKSIQKEHPTAEGLIPDTRRDLEMIRKFVVEQRLVSIPSEVRASVRETLPPFRSTSFASMDTPGPYETKATEAYYYVTPVEPEWTAPQKDEWLTAFNYYTTDVVSIHEAYPGHYVQFLALNASKAGPVAKLYNSYAFVEGWAHYTEQMVLDAGFPEVPTGAALTSEQRVRAAKFRLAQSDEALLRLCRLCVAIQMHTGGMSLAQGTQFFVDNCYYEAKPAASEANRGTFDPGYCFYTLGKLQLLKLRKDWQQQEGDRFTLQRFHDEVLRHGAPPIRLLRETMLKDPALWPGIL